MRFGSRPGSGSIGFRENRKCRYQAANATAAVVLCVSVEGGVSASVGSGANGQGKGGGGIMAVIARFWSAYL